MTPTSLALLVTLALSASATAQAPRPAGPPVSPPPNGDNSRTVYFQKQAGPAASIGPVYAEGFLRVQNNVDATDQKLSDFNIETEPPTLERLYRLDSEAKLQQRIKDETMRRPHGDGPPEIVQFPQEVPLSTVAYSGRSFAPMTKFVEPGYVFYNRLYFEEKNTERYAWNLGIMQPLVSTGVFVGDVAAVPYKMFTRFGEAHETGAGWCLPGDPVPYLFYPPELSVPGSLAEAGAVVALFALFP